MNASKTRIAYLITDLDVGGAENNLAMLARGLDAERFEGSVASLLAPGPVGQGLHDAGISVVSMHMTRKADAGVIYRVAGWLRRTRPDLLHTWLFHANFVGRLAARLAGVRPVVSSIRVAEPRRSHLFLERLTAGLADCILTNSAGLRDHMRAHGIRADKLRVIANAVDLERFAHHRSRRRKRDKRVALFVGRLDEQKGVDVLLRAAAELAARCRLRFNLVGEGPDRAKLERLSEELKLTNVHFLGHSDRVPELLADADVFVLPSRWEGLPNVVLEAMAAGCPVVATDVVGTRDLIRDGVNGLLVQPDDHAALAAAIKRVVNEPTLARSLVEAGYETARDHSVSAMVAAHETVYFELLRRVWSPG